MSFPSCHFFTVRVVHTRDESLIIIQELICQSLLQSSTCLSGPPLILHRSSTRQDQTFQCIPTRVQKRLIVNTTDAFIFFSDSAIHSAQTRVTKAPVSVSQNRILRYIVMIASFQLDQEVRPAITDSDIPY